MSIFRGWNQTSVKHLIISAGVLLLISEPALAGATVTQRVSTSYTGAELSEESHDVAMSADSRYIAFSSSAANLVPNDTNNGRDVFLRNRITGSTSRISVTSSGGQLIGDQYTGSRNPTISSDGRYIAFESNAPNLPNAGYWGIYLRDRVTGTTKRIDLTSSGGDPASSSWWPSISGDGRFIAYASDAPNLVPNDTNGTTDVFLHDRTTGTTTRISGGTGPQANGMSWQPSIALDGQYIAYASQGSNLVPTDTNGTWDVFLYDRSTGNTVLASVSPQGTQGNDASFEPSLSRSGNRLAFTSWASNLAWNDTNNASDVFIRNTATGGIGRVSVSSGNVQGNGGSGRPFMDVAGGGIAFVSDASNLVPNDGNSRTDVFVRNLSFGTTIRVSLTSTENEATTPLVQELCFAGDVVGIYQQQYSECRVSMSSWSSTTSPEGRFIAFSTTLPLVPEDNNGLRDVYYRGPLS